MQYHTYLKVLFLVCGALILNAWWIWPLTITEVEKPQIITSCVSSEDVRRELSELVFFLDSLLHELGVPYFLCYGTLWGALRMKQILPWESNVEICVLDQEIFKVDQENLRKHLSTANISMNYDTKLGVYYIRYKKINGEISVFRKISEDLVTKAGWRSRLFYWVLPEKINPTFPFWLIEKPLPVQDFLEAKFPVPHGGFEIQQYLYPGNWWLNFIPANCENTV